MGNFFKKYIHVTQLKYTPFTHLSNKERNKERKKERKTP